MIKSQDFTSILSSYPQIRSKIAIAISGGPDSLCLMLLLHEWVQKNHRTLVAITCDHGLRPESLAEALWVKNICKALNIEHHILTLEGAKPKTGIQEWARFKRYEAFELFCIEHNIQDLFLAHHQDDQIETFLMRLLAKSTWYGLASMPVVQQGKIINLVRPLLHHTKNDLIETLQRFNTKIWMNDPSNNNQKYLRSQIRHELMPSLPIEMNTEYLVKTIDDIRFYRDALDEEVNYLHDKHIIYHLEGYAQFKQYILHELPQNIVVLLLKKCLKNIGAHKNPIRYDALINLIEKLRLNTKKITLAHCLIERQKDLVNIFRENRHLPNPQLLKGKGFCIWDNRYLIKYDLHDIQNYSLEPIGKNINNVDPIWLKSYRKKAFFSFPVLKGVDGFIHLPHLCYSTIDVFLKVDFLPLWRKNCLEGNII
ncbi:MAG: tRNA lysidine(34) synthetase TilS [Alphaproteobacteria bacterium]|nr:tRNA lysidine(34) synthetase TilS [Alphaproteobacteria bacterium]